MFRNLIKKVKELPLDQKENLVVTSGFIYGFTLYGLSEDMLDKPYSSFFSKSISGLFFSCGASIFSPFLPSVALFPLSGLLLVSSVKNIMNPKPIIPIDITIEISNK